MMKKAAPDTLSVLGICLISVLLAAGCSGSSSSNSGGKDSIVIKLISIEKEGAVTFSIDWRADPGTAETLPKSKVNSDCGRLGIAQITCDVYKNSDVLLTTSALGQCPSSKSTIRKITPGEDLTIVCAGADADGNITHKGQIQGIKVIAGETTNAGILSAHPFSAMQMPPEGGANVAANSTTFNLQHTTRKNTAIQDLPCTLPVKTDAVIDLAIRATAPNANDALAMNSGLLPDGAVFDAATGKFIRQATAEDAVFFQIKYTACDNCSDKGLYDSQKVSFKAPRQI